jgi:hypothetical protein
MAGRHGTRRATRQEITYVVQDSGIVLDTDRVADV